jgi:hypothetical protein
MGHALLSLVTGGGVKQITIQMNSSGETLSTFKMTRLGKFQSTISLLAGYPMPGIFATLLMVSLYHDNLKVAVNLTVITCLICLFFSCRGRSLVGIFYTLLFGSITAICFYYFADQKLTYLWVFVLSMSLYIGSASGIWELFKLVIFEPDASNDAVYCSERIFKMPPILWAVVLLVLSIFSIIWLSQAFSLDNGPIFQRAADIFVSLLPSAPPTS